MRLELRGSRMLAGALLVLGIAAGSGLFLTDMPITAAVPGCAAAVAWGIALARRERSRPVERVLLRGDGSAQVDGEAVDDLRLDWQGVLARLEWTHGGRRVRRVGWPDVVDAGQRRELRLWALRRDVRASTAAVAP